MRTPGILPLRGAVSVPGDKSISHRAALLGAMASGHTVIRNFLVAADTLATVQCCRQLGVLAEFMDGDLHLDSPGYSEWSEPDNILDVGNSGTTLRLMLGMLAGRPFTATLTGDALTRRRPLGRVVVPLTKMGAQFLARQEGEYAPITVRGGRLMGVRWETAVASAQVKSALLLAGLQAHGATVVWEPSLSRNHSELMLPHFSARLQVDTESVTVMLAGPQRLHATTIRVPGDFSSAAFLLVAAVLLPDSDLIVQGVGLNATRIGLLRVLDRMGARHEIRNLRHENGELLGDLHMVSQELQATEVPADQVPQLIDEIPILAVAATQARGETTIWGAGELRFKESDRLQALVEELTRMGATLESRQDTLIVQGPTPLHPTQLDSRGDHRLAMALAVADRVAGGGSTIRARGQVAISFPRYFEVLDSLQGLEPLGPEGE